MRRLFADMRLTFLDGVIVGMGLLSLVHLIVPYVARWMAGRGF